MLTSAVKGNSLLVTDVLTQLWPECAIQPISIPRDVELESRRRIGFLMTTTSYIGRVRWMNHLEYEVVSPHQALIDHRLLLRISAVSAHANRCRYCYGAARATLQLMGFDNDTITALQGEIWSSNFDSKTKTVLDLTRLLAIADPAFKDYSLRMREAGYSYQAASEIAYYISLTLASHRINTPLAIPPDKVEKLAASKLMRVFRPLIRFSIRRSMRPHATTGSLLNDQTAGPFERIIRCLSGSPSALMLRTLIDKALASEQTDERTKGLIYAVVARTIGARYAEEEGRKLLHRAGVEEEVTDAVLNHLRHPTLSNDENAIIGYARDSVRYQVPVIQKTLRELSRGKQQDAVVDIVGQTAFANSLARMSVLVDHP